MVAWAEALCARKEKFISRVSIPVKTNAAPSIVQGIQPATRYLADHPEEWSQNGCLAVAVVRLALVNGSPCC